LAALFGWERAVAVGLVPFIVATILKTVLAGLTLPIAWRCVERIRRATM
jgi:biotin transporter BioY